MFRQWWTDTIDIFTIAHFHRSFAYVQKVEMSGMYPHVHVYIQGTYKVQGTGYIQGILYTRIENKDATLLHALSENVIHFN